MKKCLLGFVLLIFSLTTFAEDSGFYTCKQHSNTLKIKPVGFEHINHQPFLNGKILITELFYGMWFIEHVSCTAKGFKIIASHAQYGDDEKSTFSVTVLSKFKYDLEMLGR